MKIIKDIKELREKREAYQQAESDKYQTHYSSFKNTQAKDELRSLVRGTEKQLDENMLDTMVPFADLMTLLLVFFVFFFIVSSNNQLSTLNSTQTQTETPDLNERTITIPSGILFDLAKADLKKSAEQELSNIALQIQKIIQDDSGWEIRIEGHTDNIPIKNNEFKSNWELSTARAISVVRFFLQKGYFEASQLQAMGYGENKPIVPNNTDENRKKNRRVEIKLNKTFKEIRK